MASLNTLRTKFGYVLSAIIAFALLAFIFSLKSEMGFSGNDPKVGEINSEDVLYSEYYAQYENVKRQTGITESTEQEAAQLASATWQSMISSKLLLPGFDELGISYSESERMAVINGIVPTQAFGAAFTDPTTGVYNSAYIAEFLSQASMYPEVETAWTALNDQAREERSIVKYNALVRAGAYVNKLEVAQGVASANNSFSGKWVSKPYSSIPDSLISISDAEIKQYYQKNKAAYKKLPTRTLSYVQFAMEPTEQDIIDIENNALAVSKEFEATEDLSSYIRSNYNGSITDNYMSVAQLGAEQAAALASDKMYGPVNSGNTWRMSRVASKLVAPDSVGIRHIVLPYTQEALADSLLTELKAGANFAEMAQTYSQYVATAQFGGEVGVMPFSAFTGEFIPALSTAKKGDIVKVAIGQMIQLVEVYSVGKPAAHYQVAALEYPVEASQATVGELHSNAGMFSVSAKGGADAFNGAAEGYDVVVRSASLTAGDRTVRAINDSREIARWAYGAKVGEISDVFKTDDAYVVAMVTSIDDDTYRSLASVTPSIRSIIIRDKKFAEAAKAMAGSTIDEVAAAVDGDVTEFNGMQYSSQYIQGLGVEPKVVGAITLGSAEGLTAPIQGMNAAYVFDVAPVSAAAAQTEAMERVRAQAVAEDRVSQYAFSALQEMANIKDLRGEFF